MIMKPGSYGCRVAAFLLAVAPLGASAQSFTEARDSLRGVTFFSVEIGTDLLSDLQLITNAQYANSDSMTLGFSAFAFDESDGVDDYVLWLRHEGPRRWFIGNNQKPLRIEIDGASNEPTPLHWLRTGAARGSGRLVEKLEFSIAPDQMQALLEANSVVLQLSASLGRITKTLTRDELDSIRRFDERTRLRHAGAQSRVANDPRSDNR